MDKSFHHRPLHIDDFLDEAELCDFAVLLFTKDDQAIVADIPEPVTRDNVILEFGMFASKLGVRRVAYIVEDGVHIPTDLGGLIWEPLGDPSDPPEEIGRRIATSLSAIWSAHRDPGRIGLDASLRQQRSEMAVRRESLVLPHRDRQTNPLTLDARAVEDIYEEGLGHVQKTFLTTTYLTSGFWTTKAADVLIKNRRMLNWLSGIEGRRIERAFLIPLPPDQFINEQRLAFSACRERGDAQECARMLTQLADHKSNITKLQADKCDVVIAHDPDEKRLGDLMKVLGRGARSGDTEVAIYDDNRVDIFSGGKSGIIDSVTCFFPNLPAERVNFEKVHFAATHYFEALGKVDAQQFLKDWSAALHRAATSIVYENQWIWKFDEGICEDDEKLKASELAAAISAIESHQFDHGLLDYLDIGTCTARYPLSLLESGCISSSTRVLALDADEECCKRAASKVSAARVAAIKANKDPNGIEILPPTDYLLWQKTNRRKFDLVTCMLGTLSHFAAPTPEDAKGAAAMAVAAMSRSLSRSGLLLIGTWSSDAKRNARLLDIYTRADATLLSTWSPAPSEIEEMLSAACLEFDVEPVLGGIDLYVCRPKGA